MVSWKKVKAVAAVMKLNDSVKYIYVCTTLRLDRSNNTIVLYAPSEKFLNPGD